MSVLPVVLIPKLLVNHHSASFGPIESLFLEMRPYHSFADAKCGGRLLDAQGFLSLDFLSGYCGSLIASLRVPFLLSRATGARWAHSRIFCIAMLLALSFQIGLRM